MSKKSGKIAELIASCQGGLHDPHYAGYFECFNRQLYYEAHDVLEELWLVSRQGPNYSFYKGLIQLAGAFVHLQKDRLKPAGALFRLARENIRKYPPQYQDLNVSRVLELIEQWLGSLEAGGYSRNPLQSSPVPVIALERANTS